MTVKWCTCVPDTTLLHYSCPPHDNESSCQGMFKLWQTARCLNTCIKSWQLKNIISSPSSADDSSKTAERFFPRPPSRVFCFRETRHERRTRQGLQMTKSPPRLCVRAWERDRWRAKHRKKQQTESKWKKNECAHAYTQTNAHTHIHTDEYTLLPHLQPGEN